MSRDDYAIPANALLEIDPLSSDISSLVRDLGYLDGALVALFQNARNEKAYRKAQEEVQSEKRRMEAEKEKQKSQSEASDLTVFVQVLDQIEQRIAYLEERMAERYELLKRKYGEDVIGGMAATYLTEDELAGLETDEDRHYALAAKFLDQSGEIKPEYKHLDDAKYIRDWNESEQLKCVAHKLETGQTLNTEDKAILHNGNFTGTQNLIVETDHSEMSDQLETERSEQAVAKTDTNFNF